MYKKLIPLLFVSLGTVAQKTHLHCGTLIDTERGVLQKNVTITVENNMITSVTPGFTRASAGEHTIDLKEKFVLPGLIDMHVHLESETSKDQFQRRIQSNEADVAYEAQKHARTTLLAGFTTVRDLGGSGVNIALRNAINKGLTDGPRILTSGKSIATTGGHADPTNGIGNGLALQGNRADGVINSADEARKAIRKRYQDGADWIKITATGGVLSIAKSGRAPQFQDDELGAIMATAHDYGMGVAAHAHGTEGIKRALRAGVRTIEHGTYIDDECIALFKEKGAYLVPTIIAGKTVADSAKIPGYYHPFVAKKAMETGPLIQQSFARAYQAGVNIAFGTDAGVFPHGYNAKEFVYMAEAGMPIMEALKSATVINAQLLEMQDRIGRIAPGMWADIIAVDKNPEQDITALMKVSFVMKDGKVYKNH